MPSRNTLREKNDRKLVDSPKRSNRDNETSGYVRDDQESNITQILSQRLEYMEQQLVLLRGDLKEAIDTLKKKDQEIVTLENKIALAERRRDSEMKGCSTDDLLDLTEDQNPESKSKQAELQKECNTLAQKLQEMEKFFGDYGLVWVKEDALEEKDPKNLWVRKTNVHYTPDFDKIFLVVEELNLGNAEPQIVRTGNTAQFKMADLLNLTLYEDGIQLENNPFRLYDSPSVEEFFRDLEDGYFPTELKGTHPEGVIFKVKDMRNTKFADDPHRRPVVNSRTKSNVSPRRMSNSSVLSKLAKFSRKGDEIGVSEKKPSVDSGVRRNDRRSRTASRGGSTSSRRSKIKNASKPAGDSLAGVGKRPIQDPPTQTDGQVKMDGSTKQVNAVDPKSTPGDISVPGTQANEPGDKDTTIGAEIISSAPKNIVEVGIKGNGDETKTDGIKSKDVVEDVGKSSPGTSSGIEETIKDTGSKSPVIESTSPKTIVQDGVKENNGEIKTDGTKSKNGAEDGGKSSPGASSGVEGNMKGAGSNSRKTGSGMMQIFSGSSPRVSITRIEGSLPKSVLEKELTKDSFGLPRPPLSNSASIPPKPHDPPSKHFDNYFIDVAEGTQTSGTYLLPQAPQTQPTHITNITYNEGPITIQMTPSELKGTESRAVPMPPIASPTLHPRPGDRDHAKPEPHEKDETLIKISGETEYREKYTEGAINSMRVLEKKKMSQEHNKDQYQEGTTRMTAPDVPIASQNVPSILADPRARGLNFDPNVHWPNFQYFGHQKGKDTIPSPPPPVSPQSPKNEADAPNVVELNKKTSDRMISVKMRTKSGSKVYVAYMYADESTKTLTSLLKMNNVDATLIEQERLAELSSPADRRVVVSSYNRTEHFKQFHQQRPNLGATNPELFKKYLGEKEDRKREKPKLKVEAFIEKVSSDRLSLNREIKESSKESEDLIISRYENRDWLSKEVYSKKTVPRVTSSELKKMSDMLTNEVISTTSVTKVSVKQQIKGGEIDSPPKIVSEDVLSTRSFKAQTHNDSILTRKVSKVDEENGTINRPMILPKFENSSSSSLISESKCHMNSFVAEPRKRVGRQDIHGSTSSLNIVAMDETLPVPFTSRFNSGTQEKDLSRSPSDTSVLTEPDRRESHSLIFKRVDSEESTDFPQNKSSVSALLIESLNSTPRVSEQSLSYGRPLHSITGRDAKNHAKKAIQEDSLDREISNFDEESNHVLANKASTEELQTVRQVSSSGIRSDGFQAATLLEMVDAMLKARKEWENKKLENMTRNDVLVLTNSSEDSVPTEFVPPPEVVKELEELKRSLDTDSAAASSTCCSEKSIREYAERLLDELLTKKSTPNEIIRKLQTRKGVAGEELSIIPETPAKRLNKKRSQKVTKSRRETKKRT